MCARKIRRLGRQDQQLQLEKAGTESQDCRVSGRVHVAGPQQNGPCNMGRELTFLFFLSLVSAIFSPATSKRHLSLPHKHHSFRNARNAHTHTNRIGPHWRGGRLSTYVRQTAKLRPPTESGARFPATTIVHQTSQNTDKWLAIPVSLWQSRATPGGVASL